MDAEEGKPTSFIHYYWPSSPEYYERYDILEAIGVGCNGAALTVYKAQLTETGAPYYVQPRSVGLMYVKESEEKSINAVLDQEKDILSLDPDAYDILRHNHRSEKFLYRGYYCIAFPYPEHGSLLSLMARRFPRGLPEKLILFCARYVLNALHFIHQKGRSHRQISAAHIFLYGRGSVDRVRLAYAVTLHHLFVDQLRDSASPYLPATTAWSWAAAPPHDSDNGRADDIWLIGITLLEMAYGGLRVKKRDDLDFLINKIRKKNKLPKKLNDDGLNEVKWATLPACFTRKKKKKQIAPNGTGCEHRLGERVFSKEFVTLVVRCLDRDPAKRPTTHELLRTKILRRIWIPFVNLEA